MSEVFFAFFLGMAVGVWVITTLDKAFKVQSSDTEVQTPIKQAYLGTVECVSYSKGHHDTHQIERNGIVTIPIDGQYAYQVENGGMAVGRYKAGEHLSGIMDLRNEHCQDFNDFTKTLYRGGK